MDKIEEVRFLPISRDDMIERGWEYVDFAIVTADAYVDHHSFGTAIISRVLESAGYKIGIIAQPNWKSTEDFMRFGRPRLGFLVNGGNMDPMVNIYTVAKRPREKDLYSPGGKTGLRPERSTIVYCNKIREAYKDIDKALLLMVNITIKYLIDKNSTISMDSIKMRNWLLKIS